MPPLREKQGSVDLTAWFGYLQGSAGGPSEGNVSGYLIRSTATAWAKGSLLAVDAGTHLAGIIRILEEHSSSLNGNSPDRKDNLMAMPRSASDGLIGRPFPFVGANLPYKTPRANAVYITRELVSTYLITHPHLDHLSGFVINTAALTQTKCPKRLASLPSTIEAIKTHIFNDVIWPNLSDEESGVGLVTYQRLPVAALDYVEVCKGLSVQAWPISHGHCMNTHSHRGSTSEGAERSPGGSIKGMCVYDSAVFFIRDEETKKEVMMWGDVEPDSLSLSPRNHPAWDEAATKFHKGLLDTIFIECSYDCCQPDKALYGHLSPQHLLDELQIMAERVVALTFQEERERRGGLRRKRMGQNLESITKRRPVQFLGNREENYEQGSEGLKIRNQIRHGKGNGSDNSRRGSGGLEAPPKVVDKNGTGSSQDHLSPTPQLSPEGLNGRRGSGGLEVLPKVVDKKDTDSNQDHLPPTPQLSPEGLSNSRVFGHELDSINMAVRQRTPELRIPSTHHPLPSSGSISSGLLLHESLKGLHLVITHVKDTLEDDIDVADDILASLKRLEGDRRLGCTFSLSEQGRTFYF